MIWGPHILALSLGVVLAVCAYFNYATVGRPSYSYAAGGAVSASGIYTGNIWLYAMVATDYGDDILLEHFIQHYHHLGVPYDRFLFVLYHNPTYKNDATSGYQRSVTFLRANNFAFRIWEDQYSSHRANANFLELALEVAMSPYSWIVKLHIDEFLQTDGRLMRELITEAEREGATFIEGSHVDRLARGGVLRKILPGVPLEVQMPVACSLSVDIAGPPERVFAFKAFLRPEDEGRRIVPPKYARPYFSACSVVTKMPVASGIIKDCSGSKQLEPAKLFDSYHLTPYAKYSAKYAGKKFNATLARGRPPWEVKAFSQKLILHHVKWHSGVVANLRDRAGWYRGDCNPGIVSQKCTPRHADWRQLVHAVNIVSGLDPFKEATLTCIPGTNHQEGGP